MTDFRFLRRRVYSAAKFAKRGNSNARFDTSDIAQESLVQLLKEMQVNGLDAEAVNERYLQTVGRGTTYRMIRDNLAQCRSMASEASSAEFTQLPCHDDDPQQNAEDQEVALNLIKAIGQLNADHQLIIFRRFFDQHSFTDIANELKVSFDVVRHKYDVAIAQLRKLLP